MSVIAVIEDALIARIQQLLGTAIRTVEWAPPDWDEDFIKRNLLGLPGVFVVFGGGSRSSDTQHSVLLDTQWSVVAVTRHVQEAKQRARGDAREVGCYDILEALAPHLDGFTAGNVTRFDLLGWGNSAALKLEKQALMIQELSFSARIEIPKIIDGSELVPFKTFHDTFEVGQLEGAPITEDSVELPQ